MKTIFRLSIIVCLAFTVSTVHAQQVTSPVMTYVPDPAGALHPLLGIAGAASLGDALNGGFGIREAFVPPAHDYLLAMVDGSSWPALIQIRDSNVTAQSIQQDGSTIDRVELSPAGSAAGLLSESEGRIYVFRNLAASPALAGVFDLGNLGTVSAFAVSDSGNSALVGVFDGNAGTLVLMNLGEQPQVVASLRHASAIEFLHQSDGAVIADDLDNKVYGFIGGQIFVIADEKDGIAAPVAVAVGGDNSKAFVINSGSQSITKIGPFGVVAQPVHCDCTLTGFSATSTDSVFRVTDFSGGPVVLFDGNSQVPRMLLVPAGPPN
jgi:hypothetical protein